MRVQRFEDDSMNKVLARIRADMGSNAVLVSSRNENGRTEVIAAQDYDPAKLEEALAELERRKQEPEERHPPLELLWEVIDDEKAARNSAAQDKPEVAGPEPAQPEPVQPEESKPTPVVKEVVQEPNGPSLESMFDEISRLRKLFEGELAYVARRAEPYQPHEAALIDRLQAASLDLELSKKIVRKALPCTSLEAGWRRVQQILCRVIRISENDVRQEGGVIALCGTSGVGKTAAAAKIAAQFALRHGRNQIAFITTDTNRVGGQSQLIALGAVLGIPVQVLNDYKEAPDALESFAGRKLVVIDTAGVNQRDLKAIARLRELTQENPSIKPYLVLPANTQEAIIADTLQAFAAIRLEGSIITKLDESAALGPVLSGLIRHKLPIAYISSGQKVPEDLQRARISHFVNHINKAHTDSEKQSEAREMSPAKVANG